MKVALIVSSVVLCFPATAAAWEGNAPPRWHQVTQGSAPVWSSRNPWIRLWTRRDHDLRAAEHVAAATMGVSEGWLRSCRSSEGGSTPRETLRWALHVAVYGHGWNTTGGSYAFGPWQFMLDRKPAPSPSEWGTFKTYVHRAFNEARRHHVYVPFRFKRPDSYVGQALTAAYMFRIGQSGQWNGNGC